MRYTYKVFELGPEIYDPKTNDTHVEVGESKQMEAMSLKKLQNSQFNAFEKNKSLEVEVEKLKSALVVKDLQKDLDHSEEKHKLKDEIISLLKDRPKNVKVEVLPASAGSTLINGTGTGTTITTSSSSYGVR